MDSSEEAGSAETPAEITENKWSEPENPLRQAVQMRLLTPDSLQISALQALHLPQILLT